MRKLLLKLNELHDRVFQLVSYAQSPFLLLVRLYWGWQLAQSGWGKLHNLDKVTEFFTSLNLPHPAQMAVFIACVEFFGRDIFRPGTVFPHDGAGPYRQHAHGVHHRRPGGFLLILLRSGQIFGGRSVRLPFRIFAHSHLWPREAVCGCAASSRCEYPRLVERTPFAA